MNCSECGESLEDQGVYRGAGESTLCAICWMIWYFDIPAARVWKVKAEIDHYRRIGMDESVLRGLWKSTIRTFARARVNELTEMLQPTIDRVLARGGR